MEGSTKKSRSSRPKMDSSVKKSSRKSLERGDLAPAPTPAALSTGMKSNAADELNSVAGGEESVRSGDSEILISDPLMSSFPQHDASGRPVYFGTYVTYSKKHNKEGEMKKLLSNLRDEFGDKTTGSKT